MTKKRAVITGLGVISPIGIGIDTFWENLLNGEIGIDKITRFDASNLPSQIAAEVKNFDAKKFFDRQLLRSMSLQTQFACAGFLLAQEDSRLEKIAFANSDVIVGSASSALDEVQTLSNLYHDVRKPSPLSSLRAFMSGPASYVAFMAKANGLVITISNSCASGVNALGYAFERIRSGTSTKAIVVCVDTPVNPVVFSAFCASNFLSEKNDSPKESVKPLDKLRERHVSGEGAVAFIIEELNNAKQRKSDIYAEIKGFASSTENLDEHFSLDRTGTVWAGVLRRALNDAEISFPDLINAHAPGDRSIDFSEAMAIKKLIAKRPDIPVVSLKGSVGQGFSVGGGLQVASSCMSIQRGIIPRSTNYAESDSDIGLNVVNKVTPSDLRSVLISSHGLGGINSALVLSKITADEDD
jgi:3-oxoacyl-[acyl-carrier-protein] synthase II